MSGDYIERAEFERAIHSRDNELRTHYDEVCGAAMLKIAETERVMGEKLSKNIKWLIGTLLLAVSLYATIAIAIDTVNRSDMVAAAEKQTATDMEQTQQILDAWRAIERSATIVSEHSNSSKREFNQNGDAIKEIRRETRERVMQLEAVQREHERSNGH